MFKRTSTPARNHSIGKKKSIGIQIDCDDQLLIEGKTMNDKEFEMFIKVRAIDRYWKLLAERARIHLEDQLEENRQLHELLQELNKENEQLNNVCDSILSEYDSGIELHTTNDSQI
ncbi:hypothetical protein I4U23_026506 [Adineta vaga]|nr:hypothetical protein I4U23_026506 [Adineta vaga]